MMGDATVTDVLPAGLEYVDGSAKVSYDVSSGKTLISSNFDTRNGNSSYGNIKKTSDAITTESLSTGETKLTIQLENLRGFSNNDYQKNEDGTYTFLRNNSTGASEWYKDGNVVLTIKTRITDAEMLKSSVTSFTNKVTVTNDTMACGSCTTYATQQISERTFEDTITKEMGKYNGGTTLSFTLDINSREEDLIYTPNAKAGSMGTLEILDVMSDKMSLATHQSNYFVVTATTTDQTTGAQTTTTLTPATSDQISNSQYYVAKVDGEEGKNTYRIVVPDGMAIKINYKVTIDAAVGENPLVSNKAYFNYSGTTGEEYTTSYEKNQLITKAQGATDASADKPSFQIYKQDQ
jgi:hypothetical protein